MVPKPKANHAPTKLTHEVLSAIHTMIYNDAHVTLETMQKSISQQFSMAISIASIQNGCKKLNYCYKSPQHTHLLTSKQMSDRVSFAYTLVQYYYSNEIDLTTIVFSKEEDEMILKNVLKYGTKWECIAKLIRHRTPTMIKNRFNTHIKKNINIFN